MRLPRYQRTCSLLSLVLAVAIFLGAVLADQALAYRFVVMGDSRSQWSNPDRINTKEVKQIRDIIRRLQPKPEFVIFLADMAYCGANKPGEPDVNLTKWNALITGKEPTDPPGLPRIVLKNPALKLLPTEIRLYPAIGNHELYKIVTQQGKQKPVCAFFNQTNYRNIYKPFVPGDGKEINAGYEALAYSFEAGAAEDQSLFVVLDSFHITQATESNPSYWYEKFLKEQRDWLAGKLEEHRGYPFIFVLSHMPARPLSGSKQNDTLDRLWLILDRYNISAYFGAHEHTYDRKYIDPGDMPYTLPSWHLQNKILHIITGKAGAMDGSDGTYTPPVATPDKAHADHFYNFVVVDVEGGKATMKTYGRPTKTGVSNVYRVIDDQAPPVTTRGVPIPGALKLLLKGRQ